MLTMSAAPTAAVVSPRIKLSSVSLSATWLKLPQSVILPVHPSSQNMLFPSFISRLCTASPAPFMPTLSVSVPVLAVVIVLLPSVSTPSTRVLRTRPSLPLPPRPSLYQTKIFTNFGYFNLVFYMLILNPNMR